ncbi:MAG: DNA repair protein RecO [Verrucomicrobia subdivision 3 bacterium]|nr:DNA repair protein RecO [Limisphaerales bacterium]MCS1412701.1 DNA repair protein RecO [Limisphaerales bacterium]
MATSSQLEGRTNGYIIRTFRLTDTSLIVEWLTDSKGRISTVARGALREKSALSGKLDLLFFASITFRQSLNSDLYTLKEVELKTTPQSIRCSVAGLNQVAYFVDLVRRTTEQNTPTPEIFDLFQRSLNLAEQGQQGPAFTLWFEWQLLAILGLQPARDVIQLTEADRRVLAQWEQSPNDFPMADQLSQQQTNNIACLLTESWIREIGRCPKKRNELLH